MRRFLPVLTALLLSLFGAAAQDYSALDGKMDAYFKTIEAASTADKCSEADFLISSATDPAIRAHIAQYVFTHYSNSSVMGDETVAVYVAREWMMAGKVEVSPSDLTTAQSYVRFNGRSLIGMKAPVLTLRDVNQQTVSVFDQPRENYTVLLFYDTTCAPCALETEYLKRYIPEAPIPLDVVAVYVGIREPSWARYRATGLTLEGVQHLWDPGMQSDFHEAYGVIKTPALFLIAPDLTIVGRRLDTKALTTLVDALAPHPEDAPAYVYGTPESDAALDAIFSGGADVLETAAYIERRTLGEGNPAAYARTIGDMLYYLSFHRSESYREALTPFIDQYIYGRDVWTASDSLQVLTLADMMKCLLAKCPLGAPVPDVALDGTLRRPGRRVKARPAAGEVVPVANGGLSAAGGVVPAAGEVLPAAGEGLPAASGVVPAAGEALSAASEDAHAASGVVPAVGEGQFARQQADPDKGLSVAASGKLARQQADPDKGLSVAASGQLARQQADPGKALPAAASKGQFLPRPDKAVKNLRLRKLRGAPGVIVFVSDSCASCADAAPGIDRLLSEGPRKLKILITRADPSLLDSFDLSSLPFIIYLDKKGIVTRRYVDL